MRSNINSHQMANINISDYSWFVRTLNIKSHKTKNHEFKDAGYSFKENGIIQ